jgi:hypothetical protein
VGVLVVRRPPNLPLSAQKKTGFRVDPASRAEPMRIKLVVGEFELHAGTFTVDSAQYEKHAAGLAQKMSGMKESKPDDKK